MVYTREAHAIDSDRPNGRSQVEQPVSTEERRQVAKDFLDNMKLKKIPTLLDDIKDTAGTAYASLPDRLYLIGKDGKIAFAGDKGPRGFKPELLEKAIIKESKKNETKKDAKSKSTTKTTKAIK